MVTAVFLNQKSECMRTHDKDSITREFLKCATRGFWEERMVPLATPWCTFQKLSSDAIFVVCSHRFTLFWLKKTAVTVKIFWLSFHVFGCAFPMEISSILCKSFPFPFLYFKESTKVMKMTMSLRDDGLGDCVWRNWARRKWLFSLRMYFRISSSY
jgi:hypothetical protein